MSFLPILIHPHPLLRQKAKKVESPEDLEIQKLILDMIETLKTMAGIGLAAPQIGKNLRLVIIGIKGTKKEPYALINPKIIKTSPFKDKKEEGCLSLPGVFGLVKRPKKVEVQALNRDGGEIKIKAKGLEARIIQHEIDHLEGILFIDKINYFRRYERPKETKQSSYLPENHGIASSSPTKLVRDFSQ